MTVLGEYDCIEERMMKRVESMDAKELFNYTEKWYAHLFSVTLPQDRTREMGYFKRLKSVYGSDAGLILKWFFNSYRGLRQENGGFAKMQMSWWTSNSKWWHDRLLDEAREQTSKERRARMVVVNEVSDGFVRAGDLLARFS